MGSCRLSGGFLISPQDFTWSVSGAIPALVVGSAFLVVDQSAGHIGHTHNDRRDIDVPLSSFQE
jgi:hypothetical protein